MVSAGTPLLRRGPGGSLSQAPISTISPDASFVTLPKSGGCVGRSAETLAELVFQPVSWLFSRRHWLSCLFCLRRWSWLLAWASMALAEEYILCPLVGPVFEPIELFSCQFKQSAEIGPLSWVVCRGDVG